MDEGSSNIPPHSARLLIDLETQQDDLLRQLDELDRRIEQAIVSSQLQLRAALPLAAGAPATT